jgi:hypothetical protein
VTFLVVLGGDLSGVFGDGLVAVFLSGLIVDDFDTRLSLLEEVVDVLVVVVFFDVLFSGLALVVTVFDCVVL